MMMMMMMMMMMITVQVVVSEESGVTDENLRGAKVKNTTENPNQSTFEINPQLKHRHCLHRASQRFVFL